MTASWTIKHIPLKLGAKYDHYSIILNHPLALIMLLLLLLLTSAIAFTAAVAFTAAIAVTAIVSAVCC